ncbi:choice-of-anchor D domain-containing protein [Luteolibacter marinus]|uniref:choice-of-anchor D domain-containing protein n=1 Tax=Luteolibacter marinus TaxID=2776705 RepID=UPI00186849D0|nr:choice-of-anchor D domain-containing protein [Luteolibacter marinus]
MLYLKSPLLRTILLFATGIPCGLHSAPGDLDPTFGNGGSAITDFSTPEDPTYDGARDIVVQADGKILVAGSSDGVLALARYDEGGSPDLAFNGTGKARFPGIGWAKSVALQSNGGIIVSGERYLARLLPGGTLDPDFGTAGIVQETDPEYTLGEAVAIRPDGRILVAGYRSIYQYGAFGTKLYLHDGFAVACYLPDGTPDPGFGTNGHASIDLGDDARVRALAIDSQGRIVLAGSRDHHYMAIARLLANGAPDTTFDGDGWMTLPLHQLAGAVVILPGDQILAGAVNGPYAALVRLLADGTPDPAFGNAGTVSTFLEIGDNSPGEAIGLAIGPDGGIVMAGTTDDNGPPRRFAVARFLPDGSADPAFNGYGYSVIRLADGGSSAYAVALDANGKMLVAGGAAPQSWPPSPSNFAVARLLAEGPGARFSNAAGEGWLSTVNFGGAWVGESPAIRTVVLKNHGTEDLTGLEAGFTGPDASSFRISTPLPEVIPPGSSVPIELQFLPQAQGALSAALSLSSNDPTRSPSLLELNGTGYTRPRIRVERTDGTPVERSNDDLGGLIDFGATPAGVPVDVTLVIRNIGSADMTGLECSVPGSKSDQFPIVSQPEAPLAPGGSTTLTVRFNPTSFGEITAPLRIPSNADSQFYIRMIGTGVAPELSVEESLIGKIENETSTVNFGQHPTGSMASRSFTIRNTGSQELSIGSLRLEGSDAGAFGISIPSLPKLAPGASTPFTVSFQPSLPGSPEATLVIDSNDPARSPFSFQLTGTALAPDLMLFDGNGVPTTNGSTVDTFGQVLPGGSIELELSLSNYGKADLAIGAIDLTGPDATNFTLVDPPSGILGVYQTATFSIRFHPPAPGLSSAQLKITSNDPLANPFIVNLEATSVAAEVRGDGRIDAEFGTGRNGGALVEGMEPDYDLMILPDGRIVVTGTLVDPTNRDFLIARFLADGSPDPAFNGTGRVVLDRGVYDDCRCAALTSDGRILLAGFTDSGNLLASVLPDGTLDPAFGSGGVIIGDWTITPRAMAVQEDGKIILSGYSYTEMGPAITVFRHLADGNPDESFGTDGSISFRLQTGDDFEDARAVAIQQDGKILIAGQSQAHLFVARLLEDGSFDPDFNGSGRRIVPDFEWSAASSLEIQDDGKILLGGYGFSDGKGNFLALRLLQDGTRDPIFGEAGVVIYGSGFPYGSCHDLAVQEDGKILLAGTNGQIAVVRLHPDGSVDPEFGTNGLVLAGPGEGLGIGVHPDGDAIVVAYTGGMGLLRLGSGLPAGGSFGISPAAAVLAGEMMSGIFDGWSGDALTYRILLDDLPVAAGSNGASLPFTAPLESGIHGVKGIITDSSGKTTIVVTTLRVVPTVEQWRSLHFADIPTEAGDFDDPDADGWNNLLEFATGSDPRSGRRHAPTLDPSGSWLTFTYFRSKSALLDGVGFEVEWADDPSGSAWSTTGISEQVTDFGDTERVRATLPGGGAGKRFVRLKVGRE